MLVSRFDAFFDAALDKATGFVAPDGSLQVIFLEYDMNQQVAAAKIQKATKDTASSSTLIALLALFEAAETAVFPMNSRAETV